MTTKNEASEKLARLSIDVPVLDHKRLKMIATLKGVSIREYVLKCIMKSIQIDSENVLNAATEKTFQKTDQGHDILDASDASDLFVKLGI